MLLDKQMIYSTPADTVGPVLLLIPSLRSGVIMDVNAVDVCDTYSLSNDCRVDATGNVNPYSVKLGNTIYNGLSGTDKFIGLNNYYAIIHAGFLPGDDIEFYRVDNDGVITDIIGACTIPL